MNFLEGLGIGLVAGATLMFIYKTWIVNEEQKIVNRIKATVHAEIEKFKGVASADKNQLKNKIDNALTK